MKYSLWFVFFTSWFCLNCGGNSDFLCGKAEDGWSQCKDNKVQWCHATSDEDGHFHWGNDCAGQNLKCIEYGSSQAACVDESTTCNASEFKCDNNTAYNCVNGSWAKERCGTAKTCNKLTDKAKCEKKDKSECNGHGKLVKDKCDCDKEYKLDPTNDKNCVAK